MKTKKQSNADKLHRRMKALEFGIMQVMQEQKTQSNIIYSLLQVMKEMPGYEEAYKKIEERDNNTNELKQDEEE